MSSFSPFRPPTPRRFLAGMRDLGTFIRTRERTDYLVAGAAALITGYILFAFWHDSRFTVQPQIVYVQNWPANRTDAQIIAEQKAERPARQKALAEQAQAEAERRAAFQRLQKATDHWL